MFGRLTPMVKGLLIINVAIYLITMMTGSNDANLNNYLALYQINSPDFQPYQLFTYMFAHSSGSFTHILFNMIGLIVFGGFLENFWGSNRFLVFYLGTGIGAAVIYSSVNYVQNYSLENKIEAYSINPTPDGFNKIILGESRGWYNEWYDFIREYGRNSGDATYISISKERLAQLYKYKQRGSMVGASGAIYGLLMACAMLFPNLMIMLLFPPIPIKMKYLALILGGMALYSSLQPQEGDNVAHLAHLGGMIFAYIMIIVWRKQGKNYSG
jgi:membrane associated rhomboid family serine protease